MGLPLFVAPVESDLPSKFGDKSAATRQARSSIRRPRRADSRPFRRAALLRDNFPTPGPEPNPRPRYPWIESGRPPPPEAYRTRPPRTTPPIEWPVDWDPTAPLDPEARQATRDTQNPDPDAGEAHEARLISLLGERWFLENVPPSQRTIHSPPSPTGEQRPFMWEEIERLYDDNFRGQQGGDREPGSTERRRRAQLSRMSMPAPPVAARFDRSPEHSGPSRLPDGSIESQPRDEIRNERRSRPPYYSALNRGLRRYRGFGHLGENPTADGLGDRNRSLSPDEDGVWDTLLTTLTPDPQPPSAGSSFASATASASASASASQSQSQSQSAGASSRTSLTEPEIVEGIHEQPCDSGVDNSDDEGQEDMHMGRGWPEHWTMDYPSRHRRFVSDLGVNDPSRISYVRADRPFVGREDSEMRQRRRLELRRHYRISARDPTPLPELLDNQMIIRTSREDHVVRAARENVATREQASTDADSAPTSHTQTPNDNALHGMQMIVRNLARREDIPDDWWAGAGLSRTLPDES